MGYGATSQRSDERGEPRTASSPASLPVEFHENDGNSHRPTSALAGGSPWKKYFSKQPRESARQLLGKATPSWIQSYRREWIKNDFIGALTVASLYIPLSFSFGALANVPPASSLYAFVVFPPIYSLFGSCSLMIVGPEATGSLLIGSIVRQLQLGGVSHDEDGNMNALISGQVTLLTGLMLLGAGILGLGFVDHILHRPLMKGFIGGVGFLLIVEQALPGLGLVELATESGVSDQSGLSKLVFIITNLTRVHLLSTCFATLGLAFILAVGSLKSRLGGEYPSIVLFPDRLVVLVISALITWKLGLEKKGLKIVKSVGSDLTTPMIGWPLRNMEHVRTELGTALLASLFGYFESSVTAKSMPHPEGNTQAVHSPNRELAVLGVANIAGGCCCTLPAFGGFGRSKLNLQAGAKSPMSGVFLGVISLVCVLFVSPWVYFVPKAMLAAMSCAVGIAMISECRHDVVVFLQLRAWTELAFMAVVFAAIGFHSMALGVEVGLFLTLGSIVYTATRSTVSISTELNSPGELARHGDECAVTSMAHDRFGSTRCVVAKVSDPVTFANSGDLVSRVTQHLDDDGRIVCLVLDLQEVTTIDACSIQSLKDALKDYARRNVDVKIRAPLSARASRTLHEAGLFDMTKYVANDREVSIEP